jgi:formylglycine-generating enzyme required for sulfatase activity
MGYDGGIDLDKPGLERRYEGPVRTVTIDYTYALGRTEVTQAQYREFIDATGHVSGTKCAIWNGETWLHTEGSDWRDPGYGRPPADNEPVACVTWTDVKAYTVWLAEKTGQAYRLPTEAEWEYAARAGTTGEYAWGDDPDGGCDVANYYDQSGTDPKRPHDPVGCDDGYAIVAPVGSLQPNALGLYDIIGNVWEWVEDCYFMPVPLTPTDGSAVQAKGACENRAVKGGSWSSPVFWDRPTFRGRDPEDRISHLFGFRLARDLTKN